MTLSDQDWEKVSAYADGELDAAESAALEDRLSREPELAAALDELQGLKSELSALRPEPGTLLDESAAPAPRRWSRLWIPAALAAGLALFLLPMGLPGEDDWKSAVAWHEDFAAREIVQDGTAGLSRTALDPALQKGAPDLSASGLQLVSVETADPSDGLHMAAHYRGLRGCRLTLHATASDAGDTAAIPGHFMHHRWQTNELRYTLLAQGMDEARFRAIARYSEHQTRSQSGGAELQIAMETTSAAAPPCA